MSEVNWSHAPKGVEFYSAGMFYTHIFGKLHCSYGIADEWEAAHIPIDELKLQDDYQLAPKQWPENDERIDNIGRNRTDDDLGHYNAPERAISDESAKPVSAADFLSEGLKTLSERAKQYDPNGKKELSFNQVAEAFNAVTGKTITGADVCLMLVMLKIVRQNATTRFHLDSAVDGINYMALWAELLNSSDHTQPKTAP